MFIGNKKRLIGQSPPTWWNSLDKDAAITLSNGDLTAAASAGNRSVRAVASRSTGKFYYEAVGGTFALSSIGISKASFALADWVGDAPNSIGWTSSAVYESVGSLGVIYAMAAGDVIGIAVDIDKKLFWGRKNASTWNNSATADPASGVGGFTFVATGPLFPTVTPSNGGTATANFGPGFRYGPPSGFKKW